MLFQEAPHAFNGIVLTVVGRVAGQLYRKLEVVGKLGDAVHVLRATTMVFGSIVLIDHEGCDHRKAHTNLGPEIRQAIDDEITGHFGCREVEIEFTVLWQIDAKGCHFRRLAMEVMIESFDNNPIQPISGEESDVQRCFGIQGNAQHRLVFIGGLVDFVHLVEDGVGLRNLFQRTTFFTRFSP